MAPRDSLIKRYLFQPPVNNYHYLPIAVCHARDFTVQQNNPSSNDPRGPAKSWLNAGASALTNPSCCRVHFDRLSRLCRLLSPPPQERQSWIHSRARPSNGGASVCSTQTDVEREAQVVVIGASSRSSTSGMPLVGSRRPSPSHQVWRFLGHIRTRKTLRASVDSPLPPDPVFQRCV